MAALQQQVGEITSWLLIFLAFCLPLSTSVVTILALLIFVCWIIEGGYRQKWREIRTNPVCLAVFIYLGVYLIGICWTDDLSEGIAVLMKQWKLMLLPVFLTTVRWQRRWWYVGAYIAGVSCVMLLVYLVASGAILYDEVDARGHLTLIGNQIVYTPMLALAIYLLTASSALERSQRMATVVNVSPRRLHDGVRVYNKRTRWSDGFLSVDDRSYFSVLSAKPVERSLVDIFSSASCFYRRLSRQPRFSGESGPCSKRNYNVRKELQHFCGTTFTVLEKFLGSHQTITLAGHWNWWVQEFIRPS